MEIIHPTYHRSPGRSGRPRVSWRAGAVRLAAVPLLLILAGGLAACGDKNTDDNVASAGKQSGTPNASTPAADNEERARQFAACMRAEGVDMPDPRPGGGMVAGRSAGEKPSQAEVAKQEAALEKCRQYLPNDGEMEKMSPEDVEKIRKYAKCMRDNGVPGFPDPGPDGSFTVKDSSAMGTPEQMKKASEKCAGQAPDMMPAFRVAQ